MPSAGDVVEVGLGVPMGSEAGRRRPAVVLTAEQVLAANPTVIQVVPLTGTVRGSLSEVTLAADETNGLDVDSAAQCQHLRAIATARVIRTVGNVGAVALARIRDTVATLLDLP